MIANFDISQLVGSTPKEPARRESTSERAGDSFEHVMRNSQAEKNSAGSSQDRRTASTTERAQSAEKAEPTSQQGEATATREEHAAASTQPPASRDPRPQDVAQTDLPPADGDTSGTYPESVEAAEPLPPTEDAAEVAADAQITAEEGTQAPPSAEAVPANTTEEADTAEETDEELPEELLAMAATAAPLAPPATKSSETGHSGGAVTEEAVTTATPTARNASEEETVVIGEADPAAEDVEAPESSETRLVSDGTSMEKARNTLQAELSSRGERSSALEVERLRQRGMAASTLNEAAAEVSAQKQLAEQANTTTQLGQGTTDPQVAANAQQATATPPAAPVPSPAGTTSSTAANAVRAAATGAISADGAAVVTQIASDTDSAQIGTEGRSTRGYDAFGLPQLLAEASVRTNASSFRTESPRLVAQQLAEAVATSGKRNIDVTLNPRELGHVNMRVSTTDVGVTVVINAERPETEDLMRRNIHELAKQFRDMGFQDISFRFGSDGAGTNGGQSNSSGAGNSASRDNLAGEGAAEDMAAETLPMAAQLNVSAIGLDKRI